MQILCTSKSPELFVFRRDTGTLRCFTFEAFRVRWNVYSIPLVLKQMEVCSSDVDLYIWLEQLSCSSHELSGEQRCSWWLQSLYLYLPSSWGLFVNSKVLTWSHVLGACWKCADAFKLQLQFLPPASPLLKVMGFCNLRALPDRNEAAGGTAHYKCTVNAIEQNQHFHPAGGEFSFFLMLGDQETAI